MTKLEKKKKVAVIAASCFVQLEGESNGNTSYNGWQKMNKIMLMQRMEFLQHKGRLPGNFRLRL